MNAAVLSAFGLVYLLMGVRLGELRKGRFLEIALISVGALAAFACLVFLGCFGPANGGM